MSKHNKANKGSATATAEMPASAPLDSAIVPTNGQQPEGNVIEAQVEVVVGAFTIKRAITEIEKDFVSNEFGTVTVAKTVTADELGAYLFRKLEKAEKIGAQTASALRAARNMPKVSVPILNSYGKPTDKMREESAFEYIHNTLRDGSATKGAFQNSKQLLECFDFMEDNGLLDVISVHSVKNAMSAMRQMGLIPSLTKKEKEAWEPGQLKMKEGIPFSGPLVLALKQRSSQCDIKVAIDECAALARKDKEEKDKAAKDEVARLLKEAEEKKKSEGGTTAPTGNEEKKEDATGEDNSGEKTEEKAPDNAGTNPVPTVPAAPATPVTPDGTRDSKGRQLQTVTSILAALKTATGSWGIGLEQGLKREEIRAGCAEEFKTLAALAGYKVELIEE